MAKRNTVLVLGAGASKPYGLPLGLELRLSILQTDPALLDRVYTGPGAATITPGRGPRFLSAFRGSQEYSIDAFLGKHVEYADVGKQAIARAILPKEDASRLLHSDPDDHWYRYLVNVMPQDWEELGDCGLSFVTFNYDRSLEVFLTRSWVHRFGVSELAALEMLKRFEIVHVYGSLGAIEEGAAGFVPYGGGNEPEWYLYTAAQSLRVIPEDRSDTAAEFSRARALIDDADVLCFLGFGFDRTNVERLGGSKLLRAFRPTSEGNRAVRFAGTAKS